MLEFAKANGITIQAYGAAGGGLLSDKWLGAPVPKGKLATASLNMYLRSVIAWPAPGKAWPLFQELLQVLRKVGDAHGGAPIAAVALRWVQQKLDASCGGTPIIFTACFLFLCRS